MLTRFFVCSEFPALGGQSHSSTAQAWNRINTQSPSQNRALQQQQQQLPQHLQQPQQQPSPHSQQSQQQQQQQQHILQQQQHDGFTANQKDLYSMEDYSRLGSGVSGSSGAQIVSQGGQMQPQGGAMEDFPALPRTQPGSLSSLEEQQKNLGRRLVPQTDNLLGQQNPMSLAEADKKVCGIEAAAPWLC